MATETISMIMSDLAAAKNLTALNNLSHDPVSRKALENAGAQAIVLNLASTIPQTAATWLESMPEYQLSPAYSDLAGKWAALNPQDASRWVNSLKEGNNKNHAIAGLINTVKIAQPVDALRWAAEITDPDYQTKIVKAVTPLLLDQDTNEIQRVIEQSKFSDETRALLRAVQENMARD
jgi:hypothetical protein